MLTSSNDGRTAKMNKLIWRIFTKKHGITLQQDAVEFLLERFHGSGEDDDDDDWQVPLDDVQRTLEFVAEQFVRRQDKSVGLDNSSSSLVGKDALQALIDGVMRSAMQTNDGLASVNVQDYIHVIDAFQLARWEYDPHSKQFKQYLFSYFIHMFVIYIFYVVLRSMKVGCWEGLMTRLLHSGEGMKF